MHSPALLLLVICHTIVTNLGPAEALPRPIQFEGRRPLISTKRGKRIESLMRLGPNKQGVIFDWSLAGRQAYASLRVADQRPPIFTPPRAQLNGNLGTNSDPPRRLRASEQYQPARVVAPRRKFRPTPEGLKQLSDDQKEEIATEFLVKFNYSTNQYSERKYLIKTMQRNYGLNQTGVLDEPTITAMMEPRCGFPDRPAEYNTFPNRERWSSKDVTYSIKGYTPDMSQCRVRNAFKRAFRVWEEITDLTFKEVENGAADIIIYFGYEEHGDGYAFDGPNGLLAHAFTPGTEAISGDAHFDEAEFWTLGRGRVIDTYQGNADGDSCVFPFRFLGVTYDSCTSDGRNDGLEWCSTTANYNTDKKWGFCPQETLFTYGGNAKSDPCVFPFTFLGTQYDGCTYEGRNDGYRWCATTSNYDTDEKWGFCPDRAHGTTGGNANGRACKFPFIFQKSEYSQCTTQGRSDFRLWCATTDNYDVDGQWGFCEGEGYSLYLVAAHEFGHAIGLDHSNIQGALMYPVYAYYADFKLPEDDTRGARDLYGGPRRKYLPPLELEKCGGDLQISETGGTSSTSTPTASETPTSTTTTRFTTRPKNNFCIGENPPTNICQLPIDAVMLFQNEYFVFQGEFVWRVSGRGKYQQQSVERISRYWPVLRCGVDAAYQRPDGKLVFFKGSRYYVFNDFTILAGYPFEVTKLGLREGSIVNHVVLMNIRRKEKRTYYFVGDEIHRANDTGFVMKGSAVTSLHKDPAWVELPKQVDAVFMESLTKPYTIFLKGNKYYRYENRRGGVDFVRNKKRLFRCPSTDRRIALPLKS